MRKFGIFLISLLLFIFAINLMKEGAYGLEPLVKNILFISNPLNSLGFGWLFAYVIMSGSPVAASALALFDSGVINATETFTMINGSRFGASFIVLFIGFLYVLRGKDKSTSLGMGLLTLTVTMSTYILGLFIGLTLLSSQWVYQVHFNSGTVLSSMFELIFDPIINFLLGFLPRWGLFILGLGVIMGSFQLFDVCLPQMTIKESQFGRVSRLVYRPWVMFLLGGAVTMISMSVSVSLSILVPLSQRGFIRRENVVPYIMGANITTFIDTLLASVLLSNPHAFVVVFVELISITMVSAFTLLTMYHHYERWILGFVNLLLQSERNIIGFIVVMFIIPIILMFV